MSRAEQRLPYESGEVERVRRERSHSGQAAERQTTEFSVAVRAAEISESDLEPHIIRGRE